MYLYQRPDSKFYWAYVEVENGPPVRFSTRKTDKNAATKMMVRKSEELNGPASGQPEISLGDAIKRAVRERSHSADAKNFKNRADKLAAPGGRHEGDRFGEVFALRSEMKLHELTEDMIEDLKLARLDEGRAAATINNELKVISKSLKVCTKYRRPADLRIKMLKTTSKLRYLLPGEEPKLLAELDPERLMKYQPDDTDARAPHIRQQLIDQRDLVLLLLDTGVRHTEGSTLLWTSIDTQDWQHVSIWRSKVGKEAILPLSTRLCDALKARWEACGRGTQGPYVFPGWDGTETTPDRPRGHATGGIRKAVKRAGLNAPHLVTRYTSFTVHSLRHSFAARMVQAGMPLAELRDLLGHTSIKTTEIYAHLAPSQGADRMRQILNANVA